MPDFVKMGLAIWAFFSVVSVAMTFLHNFVEDGSPVDTYKRCIRYPLDNRQKFTPLGRIVITPIWITVGILLPVPMLAVVWPVFLLGWVMYQSFRLILFK
jgi:hypothetical protein